MEKGESDSDGDSRGKSPLHSEDGDEEDREVARAPPVQSIYSQSSSRQDGNGNIQGTGGNDRGTKRRSEELAKWELANKREASRLSSMRCQQRKRKRMKYLQEEEDRLKVLNQNISQQNSFLRKLITTIRDTLSALPTQGMQNNPLAMAQALYSHGIIGQMQHQPQFVGVPQMAISQTLNLSLALMASMNQQLQGQSNQTFMNPLIDPSQIQQPFGIGVHQLPSINHQGPIINPPPMQLRHMHNALPMQNAFPILQNLVNMSQAGQPGNFVQQPLHPNNQILNPQQLQQPQPLLWQQGNSQQANQGMPYHRTNYNPGSGPNNQGRDSDV